MADPLASESTTRPTLHTEPVLGSAPLYAHNELRISGKAAGATSLVGISLELGGETFPGWATGRELSPSGEAATLFEARADTSRMPRGTGRARLVVVDARHGPMVSEGEVTLEPYASAAIAADMQRADLEAGRTTMWCEHPWLDGSAEVPVPLTVSGWAWCAEGIADVCVYVDGRLRAAAVHGFPRPELRELLGDEIADIAGFSVTLDDRVECPQGRRHLAVVTRGNDGRSAGVEGPVVCLPAQPRGESDEPQPVDALTADRYVPEFHVGYGFESEHHARYRWAACVAAGRRVLDAGCGAGYGLVMLADAGASSITGLDVSPVAVEHARRAVGSRGEVTVGDLQAIDHADGAFDLVTCFEAIEHVPRPEAAMRELVRVLAPSGILLISTPNRGRYERGNPHHLHEYSSAEFEAALRELLSHVRIHRQEMYAATLIADDEAFAIGGSDEPFAAEVRKVRAGAPGDELYMVAAASREPLPALPNFAVLGAALELGQRLEEARAWRARAELTEAALTAERARRASR